MLILYTATFISSLLASSEHSAILTIGSQLPAVLPFKVFSRTTDEATLMCITLLGRLLPAVVVPLKTPVIYILSTQYT